MDNVSSESNHFFFAHIARRFGHEVRPKSFGELTGRCDRVEDRESRSGRVGEELSDLAWSLTFLPWSWSCSVDGNRSKACLSNAVSRVAGVVSSHRRGSPARACFSTLPEACQIFPGQDFKQTKSTHLTLCHYFVEAAVHLITREKEMSRGNEERFDEEKISEWSRRPGVLLEQSKRIRTRLGVEDGISVRQPAEDEDFTGVEWW